MRAGDLRSVIELVDRWDVDGRPTPASRGRQVDALDALGLLDRACQAVDALPPARGSLLRARLEARLAVQRDTPAVAREKLHALRERWPDDLELQVVEATLAQPASPVAQLSIEAPLDLQLDAVVAMIVAGAHQRALKKLDQIGLVYPPSLRAEMLRWAIVGGRALSRVEAEALVERVAPPSVTSDAELDDSDLEEATQLSRIEEVDDDESTQIHGRHSLEVVPAYEGVAETTQTLRVVSAAASGRWAVPAAPALEPDDDRVVRAARPAAPPPMRTPRPLPVQLPDVEIELEELEDLDIDAIEYLPDDELPPGDVDTRPLPAAIVSAPVLRMSPATPPEPPSSWPLVAAASVIVLMLLLVVVAIAGLLPSL